MAEYNLKKSIAVKAAIAVLATVGVIASYNSDFFMTGTNSLVYFTSQSNILAAIISIVYLIADVKKLRGQQCELPNWLLRTKFVATASVVVTFVVFSVMLAPWLFVEGDQAYLLTINNILLHNVVPLLTLYDFLTTNYDFKHGKKTYLTTLIFPLVYLIFAYTLGFFGYDFGDGAKAPYFFIDYSTQGWFSLGGGKIGVVYWMAVLVPFVAFLSHSVLKFKDKANDRMEKKNFTNEN